MTVNMLTAYPEYFAAAFPVCEAYEEAWLDDEKIARLKNIPIWMTAAKSDRMVLTENHSSALYNRLVAAGAQDIRYSLFENDGVTPYEYQGHWSWIYTLNNECVEETLVFIALVVSFKEVLE